MGFLSYFVAILSLSILEYTNSFGCLIFSSKTKISSSSSSSLWSDNNRDVNVEGDDRYAYMQQTPHSGRHFLPSHNYYLNRKRNKRKKWKNAFQTRTKKRFFEGWYYRVTSTNNDDDGKPISFAFIFSIEDPGREDTDEFKLATVQVMGPNDGDYLVECTTDDTQFWAHENCQGLGCVFSYTDDDNHDDSDDVVVVPTDEYFSRVASGFQMLPTRLQGRVANGHDGSLGGVRAGQGVAPSTPCIFDLSIVPRSGWGDDDDPNQKSTAGWLASYAVFEPHWQITMADAIANGTVLWNGTTYHFDNAPFYAEKNWGSVFPSKWYWVQANSFPNYPRLSVTAGGGIRKLPFNVEEEVGMVCIHYNGTFYQAVPWNGQMEWDVDPWGRWLLTGRCTSGTRLFESQIYATCDVPGTVLRAPTKQGMKLACKDSFLANATLSLWPLEWNDQTKTHERANTPIIDQASTSQAAVEIGGGPWWDTWEGKSRMRQPFKTLLQIPFLPSKIKQKILKR